MMRLGVPRGRYVDGGVPSSGVPEELRDGGQNQGATQGHFREMSETYDLFIISDAYLFNLQTYEK